MIRKKWQICCLLFAFIFLCSEKAPSAERFPSAAAIARMNELIVASTTGTPPAAKVKQWFRLISRAPNPPGGPKLYFMEMPERMPGFDGYTYDVQVAPMQYRTLLQAAHSFGCDPKLYLPKPDSKFSEYPAIQLSVHGGGTTREVCAVSYAKACAYLNSVENLPGTDWPKNVHESLALLRKATYCA